MEGISRNYVVRALGLACSVVGIIAVLNLLVDPYNRYGFNRLGVYISAERECKATFAQRFEREVLLVGNSRMVGMAPQALREFRFFNGAFAGASSEEIFYFLEHFARQEKAVVIGIDAGTSDPRESERKGDIFAAPTLEGRMQNLLSLKTTEYSVRTIREALGPHPQPIGRDGEVPVADWIITASRDDPAAARLVIERMRRKWDEFECPSEREMMFYRRIRALLQERGIACIVLVPPMHEEVAAYVNGIPARQQLDRWYGMLRATFENVVDLAVSTYSSRTNFYPADPLHFKPATGIQILNADVIPLALEMLREPGTPTRASHDIQHSP